MRGASPSGGAIISRAAAPPREPRSCRRAPADSTERGRGGDFSNDHRDGEKRGVGDGTKVRGNGGNLARCDGGAGSGGHAEPAPSLTRDLHNTRPADCRSETRRRPRPRWVPGVSHGVARLVGRPSFMDDLLRRRIRVGAVFPRAVVLLGRFRRLRRCYGAGYRDSGLRAARRGGNHRTTCQGSRQALGVHRPGPTQSLVLVTRGCAPAEEVAGAPRIDPRVFR